MRRKFHEDNFLRQKIFPQIRKSYSYTRPYAITNRGQNAICFVKVKFGHFWKLRNELLL